MEPDDRDIVRDASLESFPASDPPPWTGMHVGGPMGDPMPPARERHSSEEARRREAGAEGSSHAAWLARHWREVQVRVAEVIDPGGRENARPTVRAVVQLGALTPADVRVFARLPTRDAAPASTEPIRLMSVRSYHNGAVVFEAAASTDLIAQAGDLLVTVRPAREDVSMAGMRAGD